MTLPVRRLFKGQGRYSDNDEGPRRRAREIDKLKKSYEAGGAYNDIDNTKPLNETLNAEKDYDTLSRVRSSRSLNQTRLPKKR